MNSGIPYRVFVSYTGHDLEAHAEVVSDIVKRLNNSETKRAWVAIDHKFWAPTGRPSVQECMDQVGRCQILIVLVAFRYGWVPSKEEGGDGESSITRMEVDHARAAGLEFIPFLVEDDAHWRVTDIEGLTNAEANERLSRFKAELRKSLAGFFDTPKSLETPTILALSKAAERLEQSLEPANRKPHIVGSIEIDEVVPSYYDPDRPPSLEERLKTKLPKRILSLDSAGLRTAVTLGYLERLEQLLQIRYSDAKFRICDYFDFIGASGTSAVVAAELARGRTVAEARKTFLDCAKRFASSKSVLGSLSVFTSGALYRSAPLSAVLNASFDGVTLGSEDLKTGLGIILTRIDTGEICSLTNHPDIRGSKLGNLPLSRVLLASFLAVTFLPPVELQVDDKSAYYFEGELSVGPDPSLHLFLITTGPTFPFHWRTGRRRISLISIGAGASPISTTRGASHSLLYLTETLSALIAGLRQQSDLALAALTHEGVEPRTQVTGHNSVEGEPSILNYKRFDVALDAATLQKIGLADLAQNVDSISQMNRADLIASHLDIGRQAAARDLGSDLFSPSFEVRPRPRASET
jgi:uncharacterized protein